MRARERRKSFEIMKEGEEIRKPFNECDSIVATARIYKTFFWLNLNFHAISWTVFLRSFLIHAAKWETNNPKVGH